MIITVIQTNLENTIKYPHGTDPELEAGDVFAGFQKPLPVP